MKKNGIFMKYSMRMVFLTIFMLFCLASCKKERSEVKFETLKKEFKNPSTGYRSAPLWVWNTDVTKADIDRMLYELKDAGFGGAFVHPRPGLKTEYLSDEWFELYRHSVEVAKKLDMDIWIYDENSYPSGFAGGHVPAQMPESYNQGQGLKYEKIETLPKDLSPYFICYKKEGDKFVDITTTAKEHKDKKGEYYLFTKTYYKTSGWYGGYSYVDLLYPGVTEKFIEITMSGYEKHFPKELGKQIKGVFTDEPNIETSGGLRWTPDLFEVFEKQWGYKLQDFLPLLAEETGNWKQVRHNYIETLLQLFIDRWAKPFYNYCEEKGLAFTGHYWEHGWPSLQHGGDNMAMYAWHQMPGIDMLFNQFNDVSPYAQFGNIRAVKEVRSVANQMGYKRILCETYGGGGWDVTMEDLKRLGDWEYVLGVNFMNQHLSHMTISGARKYDYPPVFTSHSPWWNNYKEQNDYFARLSLLLSEGEQYNDILVLEPTSTLWMYYTYLAANHTTDNIGKEFQKFVTKLEKSQVEYDLGSENIIKNQGSAGNGLFTVGKRSYKKVVLPPLFENLNLPTFKLLEEFLASGGELIAFSIPNMIDGKVSDEPAQLRKKYAKQIKEIVELNDEVIAKELINTAISISDVKGSKDLYHQRRTYGDGELLFLVNSSLQESVSGSIIIDGVCVYELDGMDGNMYAYPYNVNGKKAKLQFNLPPAGSLILFSSNVNKEYPKKKKVEGNTILQAKSKIEIKRIQDNVLTIDFCDLIVDGKKKNDLNVLIASNELFKHFGFEHGNPWNTAVQYKHNILDKDVFTKGDVKVQYHFDIADDMDMSKIRLVAEQPKIWKAKINNNEATAIPGETWLDARFGVYDIGKHLKKGKNTIELYVTPMSIHAEIEPVYILGDFSLESTPRGWDRLKTPRAEFALGSWKQQGQPHYAWEMAYSKKYDVEDSSANYAVKLNKWKGTASEVFVNDKKVGAITHQPYQLEISPYLKEGENKIEVRVIGSLKNLLGPHYHKEEGLAGPWHWRNVKEHIPGNEYQMIDYGLMTDFDVLTSK